MRNIPGVIAFLFFLSLSLPLKADTVYDISGQIAATGTNACDGPCEETINFSFQFDWQVGGLLGFTGEILPGTAIVTSTGPLAINLIGGGGGDGAPDGGLFLNNNYVEFRDTASDEFDLGFPSWNDQKYETPVFSQAWIYACYQPICDPDFFVSNSPIPGAYIGLFLPATATVTVTNLSASVPEPPTLLLLALGLIGLIPLSNCLGATKRMD